MKKIKKLDSKVTEKKDRLTNENYTATKGQELENEIFKSNNLLGILSEVQAGFIMDENPILLFEKLLKTLLSLTKSEYGFIGEVLYETDGSPFLKTRSITNIAWNKKWEQFLKLF